jgi:hypothetical protein
VALTKGLDPIMALVYADLLVAGVCLSGLFPATAMVQFSEVQGDCVDSCFDRVQLTEIRLGLERARVYHSGIRASGYSMD